MIWHSFIEDVIAPETAHTTGRIVASTDLAQAEDKSTLSLQSSSTDSSGSTASKEPTVVSQKDTAAADDKDNQPGNTQFYAETL